MNREKQIFRTTLVGSVANLLLVVFKFIAGIVGHSAAMIADAVHSLSDFITDIIVIIFVAISGKPEDEDHDYGHGKYETLATAVIGIILFFVGVGILISGIKAIIWALQGEPLQTPSLLALIAAVISIVVKEVLYHYTVKRGMALVSSSVVANAWHHRSDALSSIGTAIGIGGAIFLGEQWRILDPIAAVIVSLFIIKVAVELFKPCIEELLERSLPAEMEQKILDIILSTPQVSSPHHLRTRRIGSYIAIEVHIRMDGQRSLSEAHQVASDIERRLKAEFGENTHIGIHMEPTK
ncbi:MAG: cation transporter [Rikenellaceae bacterium]|nr:cation transporter [Rikenellaceae bacterium]